MQSLVLSGATLIDGTGREPVADAVMVVEDRRITAIGNRQAPPPAPSGARVIDVSGRWLIPGLINCHDHTFNKAIRDAPSGIPIADSRNKIFSKPDLYLVLWAAHNVLDELRQGVTTTRDLGSRKGTAIQLRNAINDGLVPGPRILAAGEAVTMTGGHFYMVSRQADGPDEVRKAVREQLHDGADCIKLMATGGLTSLPKENPGQVQFTVEELRAGVDEAHKAGRKVASHAQAVQGIRNAVEAGVDSIEHGFFLDEPTARMMLERGTHFVPTVNVPINSIRRMTRGGDLDLVAYMEREVVGAHRDAFRLAADLGILIAAATDSPGVMAEELEIMVEFGMTPAEALATATRNAAIVCGLEHETGTLEPGKLADIVVLGANPLANISALRQVWTVVRGGQVHEVQSVVSTNGAMSAEESVLAAR